MISARSLRGYGVSLGVLLSVTCAAAQTQGPASTPTAALFDRVGVISSIDFASGDIVVQDTRYRLSPTARVYTYDRNLKDQNAQRGESALKDLKALREGVRIGYKVSGEGGGQRGTLTEAWLLPAGNIPELHSGEKTEGSGKGESKEGAQDSRTPRPAPRVQTTR